MKVACIKKYMKQIKEIYTHFKKQFDKYKNPLFEGNVQIYTLFKILNEQLE